jgi:hypothetical protein
LPMAVASWSKAWVSGHSLAGIMVSNSTRALMYGSGKRCVLSSRGLRVGLITRPEESYRLCVGACVNDREASTISIRQFTGPPFCLFYLINLCH